MYLFEKDFGKHFEYLGEFYDTDARITQNPAFQRSIVVMPKNAIYIGEEMPETTSIFEKDIPVKILSWYEGSTTLADQEVFTADGQSVVVASTDAITFIGRVADPKEHFFMTTYSVDGQNHLHAKNMRFCHDDCKRPVSIVSHIYDEHGVELQRDCIQDVLPKEIGKAISTADREAYIATMYRFFTGYKFDCALGKLPVYKKTKKNVYCGYRRDLHNLEVVSQVTSEGVSIKVGSSLSEGLTLMYPTEHIAGIVSKEEIAKAIAMEENEETRNALLAYSSWRGVQKDMVLNLK